MCNLINCKVKHPPKKLNYRPLSLLDVYNKKNIFFELSIDAKFTKKGI